MKKNIISRALLGFPLGISIGYIISIVISFIFANGNYAPCRPELVSMMGNVINAVILQTVFSGVIGATFSACSVIWEIENWSIVKQTGIYFMITALVMMPVAYVLNWMEHSFLGFIKYFGTFVVIFIIVWVLQYMAWKKKINQINAKL